MIYIHIPFCRSFCTYCSFYSLAVPHCKNTKGGKSPDIRFGEYVRVVEEEAERRYAEIRSTLPTYGHPEYSDTLYIGGGTPSLLPTGAIPDLVAGINTAVYGEEIHGFEEFTVEVNPEDIREKGLPFIENLKSAGVDRISMGVQSFDDSILRWMNRRHDSKTALSAFGMIRNAGINNISIDLIFGFSGLTDDLWKSTVRQAIDMAPEHISAYQLSIEEGSLLERQVLAGKYTEADEEDCRRQYDILCGMLGDAGYDHYEVSNFALPGYKAVHNSAYWRRVPYVGLGAAAHSAIAGPAGNLSVRCWNSDDERGYVQTCEQLSPEDEKVERIMLGLRTEDGIAPDLLSLNMLEEMIADGSLVWAADNVRIPEDHFFVSDEIIRKLI